MKPITTRQQAKSECDGLKTAKDKDVYRRERGSAVILHEAAAKTLKAALPSGKHPSLAALKAEHARWLEK